jgi:hypothetical protein
VNPRIAADQPEVARWLHNFVASHAKREDPRIEVEIAPGGTAREPSYAVRLVLAGAPPPGPGEPPLELTYSGVAEGRARLAWCEALSRRVREAGRRLVAASRQRGEG